MALVLVDSNNPKIVKITLNDPDNLNAMGEEMAAEFDAAIKNLKPDARSMRAVILTGAGRAFSAGGNLEMLEKKQQLSAEENRRRMLTFYHSFLGILSLEVPLIAAINGHAIGAGLCLASACDIRVVSDKAKLGFTFTKLGLHPGMGGTYFLPRVIGSSFATELMITGRLIDAAESQRIGLASKVVDPASVVTEAEGIANEILSAGPLSVHQLLQTLRGGLAGLESALEREAECQSVNYASKEFKEGVRATIEKRSPKFD